MVSTTNLYQMIDLATAVRRFQDMTDDELLDLQNVAAALENLNLDRMAKLVRQAFDRLLELDAENTRLRSGAFTEEEFQNLCHGLNDGDRIRFEQGCKEYQRQLFGEKKEEV